MTISGKVISRTYQKGVRLIKGLFLGKNNVRTAVESSGFGDDFVAPEGTRAIMVSGVSRDRAIIIGYINKNQLDSLGEGEKRIYSTDDKGEVMSTDIILRNDGTMEVGGTGDFMVRFNELESGFNQLKSDFDGHVHDGVIVDVTGGSGSPAVGVPGESGAPTESTSADISAAKIEEIKTSSAQ